MIRLSGIAVESPEKITPVIREAQATAGAERPERASTLTDFEETYRRERCRGIYINPCLGHPAVWVHRFLIARPEVSVADVLVYSVLVRGYSEEGFYGERRISWPGNGRIAEDLSISPFQVSHSIGLLKAQGLIQVDHVKKRRIVRFRGHAWLPEQFRQQGLINPKKIRSKPVANVPFWLLRGFKYLSLESKVVYGYLVNLYRSTRGYAHPDNDQIAKFMGIKVRTVQDRLFDLMEAGLIQIGWHEGVRWIGFLFHEQMPPEAWEWVLGQCHSLFEKRFPNWEYPSDLP